MKIAVTSGKGGTGKTTEKKKKNLIIVDGPPGIGCPAISSVTGTDHVVAVTEPTASGWHDLQRLIEMTGGFQSSLDVIINKYDLNCEMTEKIEENLRSMGISVAGRLSYDESALDALLNAKTINEVHPNGKFSACMEKIWETVKKRIYESKTI